MNEQIKELEKRIANLEEQVKNKNMIDGKEFMKSFIIHLQEFQKEHHAITDLNNPLIHCK